jgi:hypothetical protein
MKTGAGFMIKPSPGNYGERHSNQKSNYLKNADISLTSNNPHDA